MICKKYENLGHFEKVKYIGELLHACQCDDDFYKLGEMIIQAAKDTGVLKGITILPDPIDNQIQ